MCVPQVPQVPQGGREDSSMCIRAVEDRLLGKAGPAPG